MKTSFMTDWFSSLSWLQICWVMYAAAVLITAPLVWNMERHAKKVDGASGWTLFGWLILSTYGLLILGAISVIYLIVCWVIF